MSEPTPDYQVGYKKPPLKTQFATGQSGNPRGRPKRSDSVSIKELLNGEQRGRNGEVISRREALVIKLLNDAMSGKQKAFARFLKYMIETGLLQKETSRQGGGIIFFSKDPAMPRYTRNPVTRAKEPV
jgi:Family of unknown function (DUF5681)